MSPCSGCETGHPSPPFALRSATTIRPRPPRSGSRRRHDESPAGTVGLCHDPTTNGSTACRMRSAYRLHGSGTCGPCATPAARSRRRLPGTTGLRFALLGRQRTNEPTMTTSIVVAPSLTPDGYNFTVKHRAARLVVAPSLTPDGYNWACWRSLPPEVVAPSLTPDGYN